MMLLRVLLLPLVWLLSNGYVVATTTYGQATLGTTVPSVTTTSPTLTAESHRRFMSSAVLQVLATRNESTSSESSPRKDYFPSSSMRLRARNANYKNSIDQEQEHHHQQQHAYAPHPTLHRRTRNVQGTFYWGAVYTLLFGSAITMISILWYLLYLCPACCYHGTGTTGQCKKDKNENRNGNENHIIDTKDTVKKTSDDTECTYKFGWWWGWEFWRDWWNHQVFAFRSSPSTDPTRSMTRSTTITSTSTTTITSSTESESVQEDEDDVDILNHQSLGQPISQNDGDGDDDDVINVTERDVSATTTNTSCGNSGVEEATLHDSGSSTINNTHLLLPPHLPYDYDNMVDHTIMVDVYCHYVYNKKGYDDDDDAIPFGIYDGTI
jgi:hypothetical protein